MLVVATGGYVLRFCASFARRTRPGGKDHLRTRRARRHHVPPKPTSVAGRRLALLVARRYELTSGELLCEVHAARIGIADVDQEPERAAFLAKSAPALVPPCWSSDRAGVCVTTRASRFDQATELRRLLAAAGMTARARDIARRVAEATESPRGRRAQSPIARRSDPRTTPSQPVADRSDRSHNARPGLPCLAARSVC